jgi:hypothetical protein
MRHLHTLLAAAAVLLALAIAPKQSGAEEAAPAGSGKIVGKVVDADGNAVSGARVQLRTPSKKDKDKAEAAVTPMGEEGDKPDKPKRSGPPKPLAEVSTDAQGQFEFTGLAAGEYKVNAWKSGAGKADAIVVVNDDQAAEVTLKLVKAEKKKAE